MALTADWRGTEVSDANEAWWKQVEQEAAQELICRERHQALLIAVRGVSPTEGDVAIGQGDEAMVGDGHAMCIAAEVVENMLRAAEGSFVLARIAASLVSVG